MLHFKIPSKGRIVVCLLITLLFPIFLSSCKKNTDTDPDKIPLVGKYHSREQYNSTEYVEAYLTIKKTGPNELNIKSEARGYSDGKSVYEEFIEYVNVELKSPTSFYTQQTVNIVDKEGDSKQMVVMLNGELRSQLLFVSVDSWYEKEPDANAPGEVIFTKIE